MFHSHKRRAVAVSRVRVSGYHPKVAKELGVPSATRLGPDLNVTSILLRCEKCGDVKERYVLGEYTLEEVQA